MTVGIGDSILAATGATNTGSLTINNGGAFTVQGGNTYTQTAGTTTVNAGGTLTAGMVLIQGGTLSGFGTVAGSLINEGKVSPGDPGVLTITGNFTQHSQGLLDLQFASGSSFDSLLLGGDANLNGTLQIDLLFGFAPTAGQSFRIISWAGGLTGNFSQFLFPVFSGLTFAEIVNANDITLNVVSAVPEPGTFGLGLTALLLAGGALIRVRRRKTRTQVN